MNEIYSIKNNDVILRNINYVTAIVQTDKGILGHSFFRIYFKDNCYLEIHNDIYEKYGGIYSTTVKEDRKELMKALNIYLSNSKTFEQ